MHEYPITCEIIRIATRHLEKNEGDRVSVINIVAGDQCGYVGDSIQMYFDEITKGTPCEKARLNIKRVIPMLRCEKCGELFKRELFSFSCPTCNGDGSPTDIGKEFFIESIEIEKDD